MNKILLLIFACFLILPTNAKVIYSEKSLYRNVSIEQTEQKRCMVFGRYSKHPDYQSCIDLNNPDYLVFSYTKLVLAGLSLLPDPQSILIIGLGGGTLPMSLEKLYPDSHIDTVEIDSAVVRVAKKWFSYKESYRQKIHTVDGRVFAKRQIRKKQKYDLIILDAFNGEYIPEHMMTLEFLEEIKRLLNSNGLLVANTFSNNKLYDHESVTYQKVFGTFNYIHSQKSGNRIIYAKIINAQANTDDLPTQSIMSSQISKKLIQIGVNFDEFEKHLTNKPDWNENVRTLSDQYSPANLLNQ